jgi:hypothetical protein
VTRDWLCTRHTATGAGGHIRCRRRCVEVPEVEGITRYHHRSPPPPPLPQARDIVKDYCERHDTSMNLLCRLHSSLNQPPPLSSRDIPRSHSATRYPDRLTRLSIVHDLSTFGSSQNYNKTLARSVRVTSSSPLELRLTSTSFYPDTFIVRPSQSYRSNTLFPASLSTTRTTNRVDRRDSCRISIQTNQKNT